MTMVAWALRRGVSNLLTTAKFRNGPATIPVPTDVGLPVTPVPIASEFPDLDIDGITVADHVPDDENQWLKLAFSALQRRVYQLVPPSQPGLAPIAADPNEALSRAFTPAHRRCFGFPQRPPEYADGPPVAAISCPYRTSPLTG